MLDWTSTFSLPSEHLLKRNTLLTTLPYLAKEWRISFEFKPNNYNYKGYAQIIHMTIAGKGDDLVFGGAGNDRIYGRAGEDILYGGEGIDIIDSGYGWDTIFGGDGCDIIISRDGGDVVWLGDCDGTSVGDQKV